MNTFANLKFVVKHPIVTVRHLSGDKGVLCSQRRKDMILNVSINLGITQKRTIIGEYLAQLDSCGIYKLVEKAMIHETADPSTMRFYKAPLIYCLARLIKPEVVVETGGHQGAQQERILWDTKRQSHLPD